MAHIGAEELPGLSRRALSVSTLLLCGRELRTYFSLSVSVGSLSGGLVSEQCVLAGCGPPPAVISTDLGSNIHATNHPGSSLTHSMDWKEKVGLSKHPCWFTAPGCPLCPRADLCRLCGLMCQEIRAACGT